MARTISRLNDRKIRTTTKAGLHADGAGLYLAVKPSRPDDEGEVTLAKSWLFVFRVRGKRREMGLGSLNAVTLAKARELADKARAQVAQGIDPIEQRRDEQRKHATGKTFGECTLALYEARKSGWKSEKVKARWISSMRQHCSSLWPKDVDQITTQDVLGVLSPIWTSKTETATQVRGRIEMVLDAARVRGLIPTDRGNPARWRGHISHLLPKPKRLQKGHHRALPYADMPAFMAQLRTREAMAALCLEFVALTAVRSGEGMNAVWSEIDLDAKLWVIPRERMKMPKEHRVPLSDRCIEILKKVEPLKSGPDSFIFPGTKPGKPLSTMALEMLLRRMQRNDTTVHGLRSVFRDWAGDRTAHARETVEEALAHLVGNAVERAYRRGDSLEKRRQLMVQWADYCSGQTAANIIPMRKASGE